MIRSTFFIIKVFVLITLSSAAQDKIIPVEKTLVVWAAPDNLLQRGGSALTIDDGMSRFDGIVFGEISGGKWMAGSNNFSRTLSNQEAVPGETAVKDEFVRIAVIYGAKTISIYRNDQVYSTYDIEEALEFDAYRSVVLFGLQHLDAGDPKNTFEGKIRDARIYNMALSPEIIQSLIPGETGNGPEPWAWWDFNKGGHQDQMHRFNTVRFTGNTYLDNGCLVLTGGGSSMIALNEGSFESWDPSSSVPKTVIKNTRLFREKLLADPYRPAYHFCVPDDRGYPGDPNGAFFHNGKYHLMYLYNREGSGFCWGHVSSSDLLHWRHHPDALGPGEGDEGAFSGGAFIDRDGTAYLTYWMLWGDKGIGMAKNIDSNYDYWEKFAGNPVIKSTEWGITEMMDQDGREIHVGSADPSNIWEKDGKYYMLTGNLLVLNKYGRETDSPAGEKGDRLYLFESDDLENWKYLHVFYESRREWTESSEDNMCPSFLPLPLSPEGGAMSNKHLLLFISHNKGCQYYIGDYRDDRFYPGSHGRMTWNDQAYFAPEALIDDKGRQIMWAWVFDDRPENVQSAGGWTGTYGLPRSLWLGGDGSLRISPVKELENLRLTEKAESNFLVKDNVEMVRNDLGFELLELELVIAPGGGNIFGVKVCRSADGEEETVISYDRESKKLLVDTRNSGTGFGRKILEEAPLDIPAGEALVLRIFVDRSIVEVFANDKQAVARAVYPAPGSKGVSFFSTGGDSHVISLKSWELMPANAY